MDELSASDTICDIALGKDFVQKKSDRRRLREAVKPFGV
jgi:hypothetical protein